MLVLAVWLIRAATANFVSFYDTVTAVFCSFKRVGQRNMEQFCPDHCNTYNGTELDKVTLTYGGKQQRVRTRKILRRIVQATRILSR